MNASYCLCTDIHTLQTREPSISKYSTHFFFVPKLSCFFFFQFCLMTILFKGNLLLKPQMIFSVFSLISRSLDLHIWRPLYELHLKPDFFLFLNSLPCHNLQDLCEKTSPFRRCSWVCFISYLVLSKSVIYYDTLWAHTYSTIQYASQPFETQAFQRAKIQHKGHKELQ